jgi:hypothetical protein
MVARLDSKPEWAYIFGASKNIAASEVQSRIRALAQGALAYYEKRKSLVILDRDGRSVVVSMSRPGFTPTLTDFEIGQRLFSHLRVTTTPMELVPERNA